MVSDKGQNIRVTVNKNRIASSYTQVVSILKIQIENKIESVSRVMELIDNE